MPHMQRKRSETGFYHAVIKGDGGQIVFEDDCDRSVYLEKLKHANDEFNVSVHAYCLMSNHVHILLQDRTCDLSPFMKQVNERYAMYYADKTGRVGHVFQDRFWSEPVNDDDQFLAVLRYIHCNPEPPGMCKARDYTWSSYGAYMGAPSFVDTELCLSLLGDSKRFDEFHETGGYWAKPYRSSNLNNHLTYEELNRIAENLVGRETLKALKGMPIAERLLVFQKLVNSGFNGAQISRITGIGKGSIYRVLQIERAMHA